MAAQNSILWWSASHRVHHKHVDRDWDPYNIQRGFWWAHFLWIFYRNPQQQQVAESYIKQLTAANTYSRPIVTQVAKIGGFYPAEEYHQHYLEKNPYQPYIVINDQPKVAALKKQFPDVWQN